jgi:hypothetical protein
MQGIKNEGAKIQRQRPGMVKESATILICLLRPANAAATGCGTTLQAFCGKGFVLVLSQGKRTAV